MYTATVQIAITSFTPTNGVLSGGPCTAATLTGLQNTSPQPPGQSQPVFVLNGEKITVSVPRSYQGATQLTYQLFNQPGSAPAQQFVLLGLAFQNPNGGVGRAEFNRLTIERDSTSSQVTVTDACAPALSGVDFNYVILVQRVSDGAIGIIDPDIETDILE